LTEAATTNMPRYMT